MSYIEESLSRGEEIHQVFERHWMIGLVISLHFLLAILTIGIWLIPAIYIWLKWKKTEQAVTNKRVIHKHGIISRTSDEMRLKSIESIVISQGIMGRILGYGTVTISGRGQGHLELKWMKAPLNVKKEIENAEYENRESGIA